MNGLVRAAILIIAGVGMALSIAWPWGGAASGSLQLLAMGVLAYRLIGQKALWKLFADTWIFSTAWLVASIWWLFIAMHTFGGMHTVLSALAVLALATAMALYYALALMLLNYFVNPSHRAWRFALGFAALWTLAECARGTWFTGFPWAAVGYAHVDSLLAAYAPWIGVYGISGLAAFLAAWGAMGLHTIIHEGPIEHMPRPNQQNQKSQQYQQNRQAIFLKPFNSNLKLPSYCLPLLAGILLLPVLHFLEWAPSFTSSSGKISVALLQGNVAQSEKFDPNVGVRQALHWYKKELLASQADLVVTPETAIPLLPEYLPSNYLVEIHQHYSSSSERMALIGIPIRDTVAPQVHTYSNALIGLGRGASFDQTTIYRYNKQHLVPFGEFIPPFFKWFMALINIPLADFSSGAAVSKSFSLKGQIVAPNICYEDLFGEELARGFTDLQHQPSILVNASNIAWFGHTVAIDQHLNISRLRSMELERPMLRATNTGATAAINHKGQVLTALAPYTQGVLNATVEGRQGITPYAYWTGILGLAPLVLACIGILLMLIFTRNNQ
jgi:apolipoprotein N-acyltransferase